MVTLTRKTCVHHDHTHGRSPAAAGVSTIS